MSTMKIATVKPRLGLDAKTAKEVIAVLNRIIERDGRVTADAVLSEAEKDPGSMLHRFFEWNDTAAATQHRLHQARQLVRSVIFLPVGGGDDIREERFIPMAPKREVIAVVEATTTAAIQSGDSSESKILAAVAIIERAVSSIREEFDVMEQLGEIRKACKEARERAPWAGKRCSKCGATGHPPGGFPPDGRGCVRAVYRRGAQD